LIDTQKEQEASTGRTVKTMVTLYNNMVLLWVAIYQNCVLIYDI